MKLPHLFMLLNCVLGSLANLTVDRNLTENHVTQDPTNKETFIPVPVNNDKFSKLSSIHKSGDDKKQSNNTSNNDNNVETKQAVEKKSFKNIKPNRRVQTLNLENISPSKQQRQQLHSDNKNNYKVLGYPFQYDYETGRSPFRYAPTEDDYISRVLGNELDLIQPHTGDEIDYYNNYNHNKRYNSNDYYSQSKRYSSNNNNNNNNDDNNVDKYYSDYDQLDDDVHRAKYLKERINSLAHLLGSKIGFETHKRPSDSRNLLGDYLGRVVLPRGSEAQLVKSYYDADDDHIEQDDDVMDIYDLAKVMLKRSDTSYLDNYIDNAIRSGLLNPKLAENYRLNVMKEYEDMLSNHDDDDDVNNDDGGDDVGDEDALPEMYGDHKGQISAESAEHFPVKVPKFNVDFEGRLSDPLNHKVEKKFQLSEGHSFNNRQRELEEFASILRQVHLENELKNMARKHANQ